MDGFFWLHIKKSAGQTARAALGPIYTETKGLRLPDNIRDLPSAHWNDALNNYRSPLGAYQFRRSEFARTMLWPDSWERKLRLAFSRDPVDRCLSMFDYLFNPFARGRCLRLYLKFLRDCPTLPTLRKLAWSRTRGFDLFLEALSWQETLRDGPDPASPLGLHFSTHTNPMSLDVLSLDGKPCLSHVFRLEAFEAGIDFAYREMGASRAAINRGLRLNNRGKSGENPVTQSQRRKIEELYARDFDIYENAIVA